MADAYTYAFAAPIRPGQTEACRRMVAECLGPRRAEYADLQRRCGVTAEAYWLQPGPDGDLLVVASDSDQAEFERIMAAPQTDFDRWFRDRVGEVFGADPAAPSGPRNELLGEWRAS